MRKAMRRSNWREIRQSKTRFFSILGIIFLGVAFYVGLRATGPDMLKTAASYYKKQNLADMRVVSSLGISDKDIDIIKEIEGVKAEGRYFKDINLSKKNQIFRIFSYDTKQSMNRAVVTQGRLPRKPNEIVLDEFARKKGYKLNQNFEFTADDPDKAFNRQNFKIVGFVKSPEFIENISRGNTMIGKGSIDCFAFILPDNFTQAVYSEALVEFRNLKNSEAYSNQYKRKLKQNKMKLKNQLKQKATESLAERKIEQQVLLDQEKEKFQKQTALNFSGLSSEQFSELAVSHPEIARQLETIEKQQKKIDSLAAPQYHLFIRSENPGYSEYEDNAKRISSLASVFPWIFFLIAALVTLTTMTRMVEEKRNELGTFKALGYRNGEIAEKFLLYATLAGGLGTLLGLAVGFYLLPIIIFNAYGQLYNIENVVTPWYLNYALIALAVSLVCSVGSAWIVLRYDLQTTPAILMQPRAPKNGKRIFLERLTFIWGRLSFSQKVTLRNLFRYKQRMLMTVIGIAGCMSMIITGFGLRDSIGEIVTLQFDKLWHYQGTTVFKAVPSAKEEETYVSELNTFSNYQDHLFVSIEAFTAQKADVSKQEISLSVPKEINRLDTFLSFRNRKTGKIYSLDDKGVIINEKLAKLFDLRKGSNLEIKSVSGNMYSVKVASIAENYVGHFIYMTPTYYQKIFNNQPKYNTDLLLFSNEPSKRIEDQMAKQLMENPDISNVSFMSKSKNALKDTVKSLNIIMWVLIVSAGLLAFIVLYNLTNINISERIRELSTIKVLGFYDNEVIRYVYRENILLTLMGILLGLFLGKIEHRYILQTVELDMTMFSPDIQPLSYIYASMITLFFTLIVGIIMYFRLKKIDMIEALKAND
ncbi:ABC transporter permease [Candidatus Enterococcus murrayae]|uniref:ABC transporter permease n=1 Tax=Candidatus Enterococcus murrayae TaxID=2815321 RepID=A0ABS3HBL5_9ENTE|nr:ABC transporter permease [Enterococcus sp. MJM16]MBO0450850.1 ABC transporter permease [Enterococcus sp. MJM16]